MVIHCHFIRMEKQETPVREASDFSLVLYKTEASGSISPLTFLPRACHGTRNCDRRSSWDRGVGSTMVTDLTPERTRFLQISAPSPLIPTKRIRDARNLEITKRNDLTLPLPRVINFKLLLQLHQKYNITQYGELGFS